VDKRGIGLGDGNSICFRWVKPITAKKGDLCLGPCRSVRISLHCYSVAVMGLEGDRNEGRWGHLLDAIPNVVHIECALQPGHQRRPSGKCTKTLNSEGEGCRCPKHGCKVCRLIPSVLREGCLL